MQTMIRLVAWLSLSLLPTPAHALVGQENPPSDRIASLGGVVPFSGWTCPGDGGHHGVITMSVDEGPPETIGSRIGRNDTMGVCKNDGRNGYVALRNLGLDDTGLHTVRFYEDGVPFAEASYDVVRLGEKFVRGTARTLEVRDFPRAGDRTTFRWEQGLQALVPTDYCNGSLAAPCACVEVAGARCQWDGGTQPPEFSTTATLCNFCAAPIDFEGLAIRCADEEVAPADLPSIATLPPGACTTLAFHVGSPCDLATPLSATASFTGGRSASIGIPCCGITGASCNTDEPGSCCDGTCVQDETAMPGFDGICAPAGPDCSTILCGAGSICVDDPSCPGPSCDGSSCPGLCARTLAACGGIAGLPCPDGQICVDDPNDECDVACGGADCGGVCVVPGGECGGIDGTGCPTGFDCFDDPSDGCGPLCGADCGGICAQAAPQPCAGVAGLACPAGFTCVDDPTDACDPACGAADCIGICITS